MPKPFKRCIRTHTGHTSQIRWFVEAEGRRRGINKWGSQYFSSTLELLWSSWEQFN
jgi:hypothetical protein